ncbi:MAG: ParB/RepB/Spo0J family partition protein, partial [Planctomycetaceae bacterium]|nr:ParB/RepB/Spo0J family partition protein [Planctomycetaceae bacterium]
IDKVIPDPDQPRTEFDEDAIERLSKSIEEKGQLSPIRVRWSEKLEKWIIIAGERRWRATRKAGLPTIDCYFHEGDLSKSDILEQQLIENCLREDLQPIEQAKAFASLMELNGWNGKQVAEALRVQPATVSRGLALLKLPSDLQDRVESGEIPSRAAYEISKLETDEARRRVADSVIERGLTPDDTARVVRQRKGKPRQQPRATRESIRTPEGWTVTVSCRKKGNYHEVEQALEYALEDIRHRIKNGILAL